MQAQEERAAPGVTLTVSDDVLRAIVRNLDDHAVVLALLAGWDAAAIGEMWQALRGKFEGNDPVAEFTYGLTIEHFRAWSRECLATFAVLPEVDRVVRVVELTTAGFIRSISAEHAWHAFLMADGLPLEAIVYLQGYDHGSNWRELTQQVPAEALARHVEPTRPVSFIVDESSESALGDSARIVFDRERGLMNGIADRIVLKELALDLSGTTLRTGAVEARGVVIDAHFTAAHEAGDALVLFVEALTAHDVHVSTPLGGFSAARLEVHGLAFDTRELAAATREVRIDAGAEALLADDSVEAEEGPLSVAIDQLIAALVAPLRGSMSQGPGGTRLVADSVTLHGVASSGHGTRRVGASSITLTGCQGRIDRMLTSGRDARADADTYLALYMQQREGSLDNDALRRFFDLQRRLDGAVVVEIERSQVNALTASGGAWNALGQKVDLGRTVLSARSPRWAGGHMSRATEVAQRLLHETGRDHARPQAHVEVELALAGAAVDVCEARVASTNLVLRAPGATDVRSSGRVVAGGAFTLASLFSKLTVASIRTEWSTAPRSEGHITSHGAVTLNALRGELLDSGDLRIALGEMSSTGAKLVVLARHAPAAARPWFMHLPQLELRRLAGLTVDATLPRTTRSLTFSVGVAQVQLANLSYPQHPHAPCLDGGALIGNVQARGNVTIGPWRLRLEELRLARVEGRGLRNLWSKPRQRVDVVRGFVEDVRLRSPDQPALSLRVGRIAWPEVAIDVAFDHTRLRGTPSVMASAIDVSRAADGSVIVGTGPIVVMGAAELEDVCTLPRVALNLDGLRVSQSPDRKLSIEAGSASCDTTLTSACTGLRASLDVRAALRGPSVSQAGGVTISDALSQLGVRFDAGEVKLVARVTEGPVVGTAQLEAHGIAARGEYVTFAERGSELIVSSLSTPRVDVRDVQLHRDDVRVALPIGRIERLEAAKLVWAGRRLTLGRVRGDVAVAERLDLTTGRGLRLTAAACQGVEPQLTLEAGGWSTALAELRLTQVAAIVDAGRADVASAQLAEVVIRSDALRAKDATFLLQPSSVGVSVATLAKPPGGSEALRVALEFLSDMQGEIGLTVPIVHERITGQLTVDPHGVHLGPTLVASHALLEQYWGWAPRWLVSRLVVSAAAYVADFFERELARLRTRLEARLEGRGQGEAPTQIDARAVAGQLVDAMVRWSAAVDVLTPGERGALRLIGDPIDRWIGPAVNDSDAASSQRERRMQDIANWTKGIALVVGVQASGAAHMRAGAVEAPIMSARVGARLVGSGTLGAQFALAVTANLSHVVIDAGRLRMNVDVASLDAAAGQSPARGETRGLGGKASGIVVQRRPT